MNLRFRLSFRTADGTDHAPPTLLGSVGSSVAASTVGALIALLLLSGCTPDQAASPSDGETAAAREDERIWISGSRMRGANGIHFGPDGRLWVASVVTPAVFALDPQSGEIIEQLGVDDDATAPDDLAFDADGALYWTNISFGTIGKRAVDGTTSVIADLGPGVNPITFSDDGRLFVSQCFMDTGLFEIDPDGEREPRVIRDDLGPNCGLNGMDWGPDDKLYGPRWFRGEVVRVDVDSGELDTVADGFGVPAAVKFDSQGRLHVLDALVGEVVRIGADGEREVVARIEPGLDNLAFDADDRLFVSSFAEGAIWEVEGPGVGEHRVVSPGGVNMPGGLALVDDRLVLADFFALRTFDVESGAQIEIERDVIGFSELGSSMSVHADRGDLITTSWFDNQVRIWDPSTRTLVASVPLAAPIDALRLSSSDRLVASLWGVDGGGQVVSVDPGDPDSIEVLIAGLDGPAGLAVRVQEERESLYVAERRSGRVLEIDLDSGAPSEPRVVVSDLAGPEGLAVAAGFLYVVEADAGRIVAVDLESGAKTAIAEGLELNVQAQGAFPDTMLLNDVVARPLADAEGTGSAVAEIFASGDLANVIYRFTHPR